MLCRFLVIYSLLAIGACRQSINPKVPTLNHPVPYSALLLSTLAACLAIGCDQPDAYCVCSTSQKESKAATKAFLAKNRERYRRSIRRARSWLDGLTVDPVKLRAAGIKGKKKLVELLDAYVRLHAIASEKEKIRILDRVRAVVAVTYTPEYHDMLTISDKHFKQDSTSYLRAALLMEKLGMDTKMYRSEIAKIHERLNGHMRKRGSHQKMTFHWYYSYFGLEEPFDLAAGFESGIIASRLSPYSFNSNLQVYHLTHEIFVPYEYGEKLESDYFSRADLEYLQHALDRLTVYYIMNNDPDIIAELISCLRLLRMTDLSVYREGLEYLLSSQKPEGKWGDYERYRKRYGDLVDQGFYLHTTTVTIKALSIAFDFPEKP